LEDIRNYESPLKKKSNKKQEERLRKKKMLSSYQKESGCRKKRENICLNKL